MRTLLLYTSIGNQMYDDRYNEIYKKLQQYYKSPSSRRKFFKSLLLGDVLAFERRRGKILLLHPNSNGILLVPGSICTLEQLDSFYRLNTSNN